MTVKQHEDDSSGNVRDRPQPESYRMLIENAWRDLHHSRVQEWSALGVVAGAHFAILQAIRIIPEGTPWLDGGNAVLFGAIVAAGFAMFGAMITLRHRRLMRVKLNWIFLAEDQLGLIFDSDHPFGIIPRDESPQERVSWKGISRPRPLSTSALILGFYVLLLILDIGVIALVAAT